MIQSTIETINMIDPYNDLVISTIKITEEKTPHILKAHDVIPNQISM